MQFGMKQLSPHKGFFWSFFGNSSISNHDYVKKPYVADAVELQLPVPSAPGNGHCSTP